MRSIIFRALAGLLSVAFLSLFVFGNTSKMSLRDIVGGSVIGVGFGLYALLGSDLGERFIWLVFVGRDPKKGKTPTNNKPTENGDVHRS